MYNPPEQRWLQVLKNESLTFQQKLVKISLQDQKRKGPSYTQIVSDFLRQTYTEKKFLQIIKVLLIYIRVIFNILIEQH